MGGLYDLSFERAQSFNLGFLVPIGLQEVLPGDSWIQNTTALVRAAPMNRPVMSKVFVDIFHYFVPTRIIDVGFEDFITGGPDGNDATVNPYIDLDTTASSGDVGSLADYLGVPSEAGTLRLSAHPFRVYQKIYNEEFRDPLLPEAVISTASGADTTTSLVLQRAAWLKDYFTTARADTQLGDEVSVDISAAVTGSGNVAVPRHDAEFRSTTGGGGSAMVLNSTPGTGVVVADIQGPNVATNVPTFNMTGASIAAQLAVNGSDAFTVRAFRIASAIQRYKERRLEHGSKYTEYLRSLGVHSADGRLQRPELLGRGRSVIKFSEVLQTGVDSSDEGVGTLRGHGIAGVRSNRFKRHFTEHGFVMTLICVRPKALYMEGLPAMWSRTTKEQYWQPELENLGMDEIMTRELQANGATNPVFGYKNRYNEYRGGFSGVAGEFKESTDYDWHFGRAFTGAPTLNAAFLECTPTTRVWADTGASHIQVMASHHVKASRLIGPVRSAGRIQ